MSATTPAAETKTVGLFVTCLVDLLRPSVGFAAVKLLREAGCAVSVPRGQTCCGQPAWNSGDRKRARAVARTALDAFESVDYIVVPSGSCAATVVKDYPALFAGTPDAERAEQMASKTHELVSFLTDVCGMTGVSARLAGSATYHDSCSGLRSLNVKDQPRALLASVEGLDLREMVDADVCCGFGGTFCVKFPAVSNQMVANKTANAAATEADLVLGGDLGCLFNIAGKITREGRPMRARHVAEVLAGDLSVPPIGAEEAK